jgi:hypothetical protein
MFVATVTALFSPAIATMWASLVVLRVEHLVLHAAALSIPESRSDFSTEVVPTRTGWPFVEPRDLVDDRLPLLLLGPVDRVVLVEADHREVRRDLDDVELVDLQELAGFRDGRARHARESGSSGS